jgi:hypothetical protein
VIFSVSSKLELLSSFPSPSTESTDHHLVTGNPKYLPIFENCLAWSINKGFNSDFRSLSWQRRFLVVVFFMPNF